MREGIEKPKIEKEEFDPEEIRTQIEQTRNEELEDKTKPGGPGPWAGINPKHLEKSDLEIFDVINKGNLENIDDKIKLIRKNIEEGKSDSKKNSRRNFIDMLVEKANSKFAVEELEKEREKL